MVYSLLCDDTMSEIPVIFFSNFEKHAVVCSWNEADGVRRYE